MVLSGCSAHEVVRDPGAGRIAPPPPVCFDMTQQEYESGLASGEIRDYLEAWEHNYSQHISCGLFAYYLQAAGQWYLTAQPESTEAYQVLYLPPFSRPVLLRVVASRGRSPMVSAVRMSGPGADDPGQIDRATSRPMSRSEWLQWSRLLDQLGFWSAESPFSDEPVACFDGVTYLFEGARFERGAGIQNRVNHKVWYPYCPRGDVADGLWEATSFLLGLTQTYPREQ